MINSALWALWASPDPSPPARMTAAPRRPARVVAPQISSASLLPSIPATATAATGTFAAAFQSASQATGVPVALLQAVATTESADDPTAVSVTGAEGVMQLEPGTAASLGVTTPMDPTENILGGATYLADQLQTFHGNLSDAVAAYNAGPGAVEASGGIPPLAQTQAYVQTVLQRYQANLAAGAS